MGKRWGYLTLIWAGVILTLTSIPNPQVLAPTAPGLDKLLHTLLYFPLGIGVFQYARYAFPTTQLWMWVPLPIGFGVLDEMHQLMIPGRFCSILDMLANTLGVGLAMLWIWSRTRSTHFSGGS